MSEAGGAAPRDARREDWVELGTVNGVFGVRGWVKVYSFTRPRERILDYPAWYVGDAGSARRLQVLDGRQQGQGIVARLEGVDDRDAAQSLVGRPIGVPATDLEPAGEDEFYWRDLVGLTVVTLSGVELGTVRGLMETGANDVLEISDEAEHLLPFTRQVVREVDLDGGRMVVDWEPDF
jgi:16S rRNA processing protein RimM